MDVEQFDWARSWVQRLYEEAIPSPRFALHQGDGRIGLGTMVVLQGDRDATRDVALETVRHALGSTRTALVIGCLESADHLRLRVAGTPYGHRASDVSVNAPVPPENTRAIEDLKEIASQLDIEVWGLGDDVDALVSQMQEGRSKPLHLISLLDVDAAPEMARAITDAAVPPLWRSNDVPRATRQMARTWRSVAIVTLSTPEPEVCRRWGEMADVWVRVRVPDRARPSQVELHERRIVDGQLVEFRADDDLPAETLSSDLFGYDAREARRLARLRRSATPVSGFDAVNRWEDGQALRWTFTVDAVQGKMTKRGDEWAIVRARDAEVDVFLFPKVFHGVGRELEEGLQIEVLFAHRSSAPAEIHAVTAEVVRRVAEADSNPRNFER